MPNALYGSGSSNQPKGIKNQANVTVTTLATNGKTLTNYSDFSSAIATLLGYNFNGWRRVSPQSTARGRRVAWIIWSIPWDNLFVKRIS